MEIISSIRDLISLKPLHFINHYRALIWIVFNFSILVKRRRKIKSIKIKSNSMLFNQGLILKSSILIKYYLWNKKTYNQL